MISRFLGVCTLSMLFAFATLPAGNALAQETDSSSGEESKEGDAKKTTTEAEPDC